MNHASAAWKWLQDPSGSRSASARRLLLAGVLIFVYAPLAWGALRDCWNDSNYSHGVLIPLVVAWLLRQRRDRAVSEEPSRRLDVLSWLLLFEGCSLLIAGAAASEEFSMRLSGVFVAIGLTGILGGPAALRRWGVVWALLVFMIPWPYTVYYRLSFPLQLLSARMASAGLDAIGFSVVRWGNIFEVNGHALEVVRACSGVRSMMTLAAVAGTLAVIRSLSPWRAAVALALSAPVALLGNCLRLMATAALVVQFGPGAAKGTAHDATGIATFLLSVAVLLGLVRGLARLPGAGARDAAASGTHPARVWGRPGRAAWVASLLVTIAAIQAALLAHHVPEPAEPSRLTAFPTQFMGLVGRDLDMAPRILEQVGVDDYVFRSYEPPAGPPVDLYVGYYKSQRRGSQIHSPQHCYPGAGWSVQHSEPVRLRHVDGHVDRVRRMVVERKGRRDVVIYWYDTRTGRLADDVSLKLNLLRTALLHAPQDAAFVRWSTPLAAGEDIDAATRRLLRVAGRAMPMLDAVLPFRSARSEAPAEAAASPWRQKGDGRLTSSGGDSR